MAKSIQWLGNSLDNVREFSEIGRYYTGVELRRVPKRRDADRLETDDNTRAGCAEIRIHAENAYRIIYIAKYEEAIYVLHSFIRKRRKPRNRTSPLPRNDTANCNTKG